MLTHREILLPNWKHGVLPVFFLLIATAAGILYPYFPKYAIDEIITQHQYQKLTPLILLFITLVLMQVLFTYLNQVHFYRFQKRSILSVQERLTNRIFSYPQDFFDANHSGHLLGRIRGDVAGLSFIYSESLVMMLMELIKFTASLLILLNLNRRLTLICLLPIPFVIAKYLMSKKGISEVNRAIIAENAEVEKELSDTFQGMELLKSFSKEEKGKKRVLSALKKYQDFEINRNQVMAKFNNIVAFLMRCGEILLMFFGIREVLSGTFSVGSFVAFGLYIEYLYSPVRNYGTFIIYIDYAKKSYDRIRELMSIVPEDSGEKQLPSVNRIRVDSVSFSYRKNQEVIRRISFDLHRGEKLLIAGPSGSGKSTLIKLILGLYKAAEGIVYFNEIPLPELNLPQLRQKIGLISQNIFLFHSTVRENLMLGDLKASDEKIFQVLEECQIKGKILSLPNGLDQLISEKGADFSGGEKQRISLARALLKNPDVIIMDEATANLDLKTANEIEGMIEKRFHEKILIKITHRPEEIQGWKIIDMENRQG